MGLIWRMLERITGSKMFSLGSAAVRSSCGNDERIVAMVLVETLFKGVDRETTRRARFIHSIACKCWCSPSACSQACHGILRSCKSYSRTSSDETGWVARTPRSDDRVRRTRMRRSLTKADDMRDEASISWCACLLQPDV